MPEQSTSTAPTNSANIASNSASSQPITQVSGNSGNIVSASAQLAEKEIPGKPEPLPETIYRLRFKVGQSPVQDMNFKYEKDQRKAETAAREFCARWKYRFIWVEEFLVDIGSSPILYEDGTAQKRPSLGMK